MNQNKGYAKKVDAEKRRNAFKKGMAVSSGGVQGVVVLTAEVMEMQLVDMNLKPYATRFDFGLFVEVSRPRGKKGKEWWSGSRTSIPRKK